MTIDILRKIRDIPVIYAVYVRTAGRIVRRYKDRVKRTYFKKYGIKTFRQFVKCAKHGGIDVICVCGTLLGVVRENGLIRHDFDIDMAVRNKTDLKRLMPVLEADGFRKIRQFEIKDRVYVQTWNKNGVDIDIYVFGRDSSGMYLAVICRIPNKQYKTGVYEKYDVLKHRLPEITGLKQKRIYGFLVDIPQNYEQVLEAVYGRGWKVPDPGYKDDMSLAHRMLVKETYY